MSFVASMVVRQVKIVLTARRTVGLVVSQTANSVKAIVNVAVTVVPREDAILRLLSAHQMAKGAVPAVNVAADTVAVAYVALALAVATGPATAQRPVRAVQGIAGPAPSVGTEIAMGEKPAGRVRATVEHAQPVSSQVRRSRWLTAA